MPSMTDSTEPLIAISPMKVFEAPQALIDYLYKSCFAEGKDTLSTLLYYDMASVKGNDYLVAVVKEPAQQTWLFAKMKRRQTLPSVADRWPAMVWLEREIAEKAHRRLRNHPEEQPLFRPHTHLPQQKSTGAGVFSLPLGAVRADVAESAFFLFETVGEQIMHMQPQLFYKHRNIEQLAQGQVLTNGLLLAERISGTSSASHALAYVRAVELALGVSVTERTELERSLFVELERMYNHAGDLAQVAAAAGMTVGQAQLARVKEEVLRVCADVVSSRYLHGAIQLFASTDTDWNKAQTALEQRLERINRRVQHFVRLLVGTPTFVDRLQGTGIVTGEWARGYGVVGPVARACGVPTDFRQDGLDLSDLGYRICLSSRRQGDAKDRFDIRVAEWEVSLTMVLNILTRLSELPSENSAKVSPTEDRFSGEGWGVGLAEGPRGRIAHVVYVSNSRVQYCGIRSASAWNWPVFGPATANGNIQTDFPVIDASFGLSCAGMDR